MFCPECESEYQAGFTRCAECDVDLVATRPEPLPQTGEPQFDTVLVTISPSEANLVQSLLEGSGIQALVLDENLSRIDPPAMLLIGGMKVAVPKHQREMALEVIRDYRSGQATAGALGAPSLEDIREGEPLMDEVYRCSQCLAVLEVETTVCPKCGAMPFGGGDEDSATPDPRF